MARHRLDLLPLLDVFMVVLFVFATIQEQRLDDSTRNEQQLERRVAQAQLTLEQAQRQQQQRARELKAAEHAQAAARAQAEGEAEHLRGELQQMREAFAEHREQTRRDLEQMGVPAAALEHFEVLSRLLDKHSVFEIEIKGQTDPEGVVRNMCCFRVDPLEDRWSSCGVVPHRADERAPWLDAGSGALAAALRRTKGGNAMTLVRQDSTATYRIAANLVDLLQERFSDHYFHAEQKPALDDRCAG